MEIVNNIIPITVFCLSLFCGALILYIAFAIRTKVDVAEISDGMNKNPPTTMRNKLYVITSSMLVLTSFFVRLIPKFYGVLPTALVAILQRFPYLWDIVAFLMWTIAIAILIFQVPKRARKW